nr:MAG TPA: hypothetical protein [Bacteriophage sp.]
MIKLTPQNFYKLIFIKICISTLQKLNISLCFKHKLSTS